MLSNAEGRWATILRQIKSGEALELMSDDLWNFLYTLAYRTSPFRNAWQLLTEKYLMHLSNKAGTQEVACGIRGSIDQNFQAEFTKLMKNIPPALRAKVRERRMELYNKCHEQVDNGDIRAIAVFQGRSKTLLRCTSVSKAT